MGLLPIPLLRAPILLYLQVRVTGGLRGALMTVDVTRRCFMIPSADSMHPIASPRTEISSTEIFVVSLGLLTGAGA